MTSHYIATLGLKKCRDILKGAPGWATVFDSDVSDYFRAGATKVSDIKLSDLRNELALHDTDDFKHLANHISPLTVVEENLQEQFQMMGEGDE